MEFDQALVRVVDMSNQVASGVYSTSTAQVTALQAGELPTPERVADDVWAIAAPIPEGRISHTLSYVLIGVGSRFHLVDPGWDSPENLEALRHSLGAIGLSLQQLETIIVTHHHPDHLGIAARLRAITGATIVLSRRERAVLAHQLSPEHRDPVRYAEVLDSWGVPEGRRAELIASFARAPLYSDIEPDLLLGDGDTLELHGHRLNAVSTPGHTGGHLCFVDHERAVVYSGDHVLPQIYSGIGLGALPGDEPLGDYLSSLRALRSIADYEVLPGHEFRFRGLAARADAIARHHLRRTHSVATLLAELGDAPVWEYARRLYWTAGWDHLEDFFLHSALHQTEMHLELVRSGLATDMIAMYPGSNAG